MDTTLNDGINNLGQDARAFRMDAGATAQALKDAGSQEVRHLMADVQDLLSRVAHVADPEIARLRTKVEAGMASAKHALADGSAQVQRQARQAAEAGDHYVRTQPWQAVGIAAAAGLLVGFLAGRR